MCYGAVWQLSQVKPEMPSPSLWLAPAAVLQLSNDSLTVAAGYTPDSDGAATESAGNDLTDLVLTSSCTTQFTYTGAGMPCKKPMSPFCC